MKSNELRFLSFIKEFLQGLREKGQRPNISELYYTFEDMDIFNLFGFGTPSFKATAETTEFLDLMTQACLSGDIDISEIYTDCEDTSGQVEKYGFSPWDNYPERIEVWMDRDPLLGGLRNLCNELKIKYKTNLFGIRSYLKGMALVDKIQDKTKILLITDYSPSMIKRRKMLKRIVDKKDNVSIKPIFITAEQIASKDFKEFKTEKLALKQKNHIRALGKNIWRCETVPKELTLSIFKKGVFDGIDGDEFMKQLDKANKANDLLAKEISSAKRSLDKRL